jgi:hypothetical protein
MERQKLVEDTDNKIQLNFVWLEWSSLQLCARKGKKEERITLYGSCCVLYPVDILMNSSELTSRLLSPLCTFVLVWLLKKLFPEKNVPL